MKPNTITLRKVARVVTIQWSSLHTHNWRSVFCNVKISTMRIDVVGCQWTCEAECEIILATEIKMFCCLTSAHVILTAETRLCC
jgi:hypothetical protein